MKMVDRMQIIQIQEISFRTRQGIKSLRSVTNLSMQAKHHGASWNFVIWGLMFAVLLVVEKLFLLNGIKRFKIAGHVYTLLFVVIGFVIFNAESLSQMLGDLKGMFGLSGVPFMSVETGYQFLNYDGVIFISVVSATPAIKLLLKKIKRNDLGRLILSVAEPMALLVLLVMCTASLVDGSYNPFLYFRF